METWLLYIDNL